MTNIILLTVTHNQKTCDSLFIISNAEQYFLALDQGHKGNKK